MVGESLMLRISELIPERGFTIDGLANDSAFEAILELIEAQATQDNEQCEQFVEALVGLCEGRDLQTQIALRLLADSVEWPPYERGDGYWGEPSDNAVEVVDVGLNLNPGDVGLARAIANLRVDGVGFIALGMARNDCVPRDVILALGQHPDPVIAAISTHSSLTADDIRNLLSRVDNGTWVASWLLGRDGWTWPEWQYAFGAASLDPSQSLAFWQVLLKEMASPSRWLWIDDFLQDLEDDEASSEDLEDLKRLLEADEDLVRLALESGWSLAVISVAASTDNLDILRQLATYEDSEVRDAVVANDFADDENRALAALSN